MNSVRVSREDYLLGFTNPTEFAEDLVVTDQIRLMGKRYRHPDWE
jgi:hypothetical protein